MPTVVCSIRKMLDTGGERTFLISMFSQHSEISGGTPIDTWEAHDIQADEGTMQFFFDRAIEESFRGKIPLDK